MGRSWSFHKITRETILARLPRVPFGHRVHASNHAAVPPYRPGRWQPMISADAVVRTDPHLMPRANPPSSSIGVLRDAITDTLPNLLPDDWCRPPPHQTVKHTLYTLIVSHL